MSKPLALRGHFPSLQPVCSTDPRDYLAFVSMHSSHHGWLGGSAHVRDIKTRVLLNPGDAPREITMCDVSVHSAERALTSIRWNRWRKHAPSACSRSTGRMFPDRPDVPPLRMPRWRRKAPPPAPRLLRARPPPPRAPPECRPGSGLAPAGLGRRTSGAEPCRCCLPPGRCPARQPPGEPAAAGGQGEEKS